MRFALCARQKNDGKPTTGDRLFALHPSRSPVSGPRSVFRKKSAIHNPQFAILVCALLFALCASTEAQQPGVRRIGFLSAVSSSTVTISGRLDAFRQGLRELGYIEGKNITIEYRYADGKQDRLKELAADLVRLRVEVIVSGGPTATRPAKEATAEIPIVMGFDNDPVGAGFVASLARPGRNITGLSTLHPEISGKQLEILKEIMPRLSRVAVLGNWTQPGNTEALRQVKAAAENFGLQLRHLEITDSTGIDPAFREVIKSRADAILVLANPVVIYQQAHFLELAAKNRIPAVYSQPEFVEAGGFLSYTASFSDLFRRAATYVDKILKGAKPADLPVEQPQKFELVINLKTANQIGLSIPANVLARADRVIK
ncbi:MAG TPA: ABC transporter substrate-binding protein [Candidatus Eisenbacteria bacterium]|nr:ABC transporter substrate-binding protein [Candidatus Eisenbacteria bacterium]